MLQSLSAEELTEWKLFYQICPFGPLRGDYQAALVAQTIWNVHAKKGHTTKITDFLLKFTRPKDKAAQPAMSSEAVVSFFKRLASGR